MIVLLKSLLNGFVTAASFAFIYRVPQKQVLRCGLIGAAGLFVFALTGYLGQVAAYFLAATLVALLSEITARMAREPVIVFLIPGVIPLVPGGMAYTTMLSFLQNDYPGGFEQLAVMLFAAGAIAGGITVTSSAFRALYRPRRGHAAD